MRKIALLITLIFSLTMFSSPSFAGWTEVSKNVDGDTYYVDFERIRKIDAYVYFWRLDDFLKPDKGENLSGQIYIQGDCKFFRYKILRYIKHKQPMGGDNGSSFVRRRDYWIYPAPDTSGEVVLKRVCAYAN